MCRSIVDTDNAPSRWWWAPPWQDLDLVVDPRGRGTPQPRHPVVSVAAVPAPLGPPPRQVPRPAPRLLGRWINVRGRLTHDPWDDSSRWVVAGAACLYGLF